MENDCRDINKLKVEIIQNLLYKCVENLYDKYEGKGAFYISDVDFDDGEMYIRLISRRKPNSLSFKRKCGRFIEKIKNEVCVEFINLKYDYHEYDEDYEKNEFCEIGFEINIDGKKYELNYVNG